MLPTVVLRPGDKGEQVRELQSRLYQLAWLPEVTTGVYDATTKEAVQGFQVKRAPEGHRRARPHGAGVG